MGSLASTNTSLSTKTVAFCNIINIPRVSYEVRPINLARDIDAMVNLGYGAYRSLPLSKYISQEEYTRQEKEQMQLRHSKQDVMLKVVRMEDERVGAVLLPRKEKMVAFIIIKAPVLHIDFVKKARKSSPAIRPPRPFRVVESAISKYPAIETPNMLAYRFRSSPVHEVAFDIWSARGDVEGGGSPAIQALNPNKTGGFKIGDVFCNVLEAASNLMRCVMPIIPEGEEAKAKTAIEQARLIYFNLSMPDWRESNGPRAIRMHKEAFGERYRSRWWEVLGLVVDKKYSSTYWWRGHLRSMLLEEGFRAAQATSLSAEGVCVVTALWQRLYGVEGYTLVKRGPLFSGTSDDYWMAKRFPKGSG